MKARPPSGHPAKPRARRGDLSREDHALWAHVARSARPLPGRAHPEIEQEPPPRETAPAPKSGADPAHPARPPTHRALPPLVGIEKRLARSLARGHEPIERRIDLHGMRQAEAHRALLGFIHHAQAEGARVVLVITGKGGTDEEREGRGVLRRMVPHWLAEPGLRRIVLGFDSAARGHGGEGALYVRLRKSRRES